MATATKSGALQTIERVRRAWEEMGYAQRRLTEIQTGVSLGAAGKAKRTSVSAEELDRMDAAA